MQLIQTISMDLAFRGITPRIYGKQDDSGAMRGVRIELFNAGAAYAISSGTTFLLRYKTAQGAIGLYDALPDGTSAFSFVAGENTVTATFVDQMFAQPGDVECELRIVDPAGVATTWKWILDVERGNVGDAAIPSDYINAFNALAASAADSADRAEAAAGNFVFEELGPATPIGVVGATSVRLENQYAARVGKIGFLHATAWVDGYVEGSRLEFILDNFPRVLACTASTGLYTGHVPAFVFASPQVIGVGGYPIILRVTPSSAVASDRYTFRFGLVFLIDD